MAISMDQVPREEMRHRMLLRLALNGILTLIHSQYYLLEAFIVLFIWVQAFVTLWPSHLFGISVTYRVMAYLMNENAWGMLHLTVALTHLVGYRTRHRWPRIRLRALLIVVMWCSVMMTVNIAPLIMSAAPFLYGLGTIFSGLIYWRYADELGRQRE